MLKLSLTASSLALDLQRLELACAFLLTDRLWAVDMADLAQLAVGLHANTAQRRLLTPPSALSSPHPSSLSPKAAGPTAMGGQQGPGWVEKLEPFWQLFVTYVVEATAGTEHNLAWWMAAVKAGNAYLPDLVNPLQRAQPMNAKVLVGAAAQYVQEPAPDAGPRPPDLLGAAIGHGSEGALRPELTPLGRAQLGMLAEARLCRNGHSVRDPGMARFLTARRCERAVAEQQQVTFSSAVTSPALVTLTPGQLSGFDARRCVERLPSCLLQLQHANEHLIHLSCSSFSAAMGKLNRVLRVLALAVEHVTRVGHEGMQKQVDSTEAAEVTLLSHAHRLRCHARLQRARGLGAAAVTHVTQLHTLDVLLQEHGVREFVPHDVKEHGDAVVRVPGLVAGKLLVPTQRAQTTKPSKKPQMRG
ncbi:hypothetical protein V8C86DRAFT_3024591 [Haematococcus lacustris]